MSQNIKIMFFILIFMNFCAFSMMLKINNPDSDKEGDYEVLFVTASDINYAHMYENKASIDSKKHPYHKEAVRMVKQLHELLDTYKNELKFLFKRKEGSEYSCERIHGLEKRLLAIESFLSGVDRCVYKKSHVLSENIVASILSDDDLLDDISCFEGNSLQQLVHEQAIDFFDRAFLFHERVSGIVWDRFCGQEDQAEKHQDYVNEIFSTCQTCFFEIYRKNFFRDVKLCFDVIDICNESMYECERFMLQDPLVRLFPFSFYERQGEAFNRLKLGFTSNLFLEVGLENAIQATDNDFKCADLKIHNATHKELVVSAAFLDSLSTQLAPRKLTEEPSIWSYFWPF